MILPAGAALEQQEAKVIRHCFTFSSMKNEITVVFFGFQVRFGKT
jgi:hypothetical protein